MKTQAFHELYPGAVYIHEGELYEVLKLDLESRTAYGVSLCRKLLHGAIRDPRGPGSFRLSERKSWEGAGSISGILTWRKSSPCTRSFRFHNHQNLGYVSLLRPLRKDYDTESTWIHIPENVHKSLSESAGACEKWGADAE